MVALVIFGLAILIVIQRITELRLARRNQKWALSQGAIEHGAKHYPLFFILHSAWLIGWVIEGSFNNSFSSIWPAWLSLFLLAQILRYWCITSLGNYWNTRILVIPGGGAVQSGPYRFLRHPNYLAVACELMAIPLCFNAVYTAAIATCANALLLLVVRIPVEEHALLLFYNIDRDNKEENCPHKESNFLR